MAGIMVYVPRLQASLEASSIKKAIEEAFVQLGYQKPTSSQEYAITEFVLGHDVFVCLPTATGEGKSLCYSTLSLVFDRLKTVQ